jgi:hypothetical protein
MWIQGFINVCKYVFGDNFLSDEFIKILSIKLQAIIENSTSIEIDPESNRVQLTIINNNFTYTRSGRKSKLTVRVLVFDTIFDCYLNWEDKGTKYIFSNSKNIDSDQIEFWLENINWQQLQDAYNKIKLIKNIEKYKYELNIEKYNLEGISIGIEYLPILTWTDIISYLNNEIEKANTNNKLVLKGGLIHNAGELSHKDNYVIYQIDTGSAGEIGLRFVLKKLNEIDGIKSVKVSSFI